MGSHQSAGNLSARTHQQKNVQFDGARMTSLYLFHAPVDERPRATFDGILAVRMHELPAQVSEDVASGFRGRVRK
jgi:hypothetical protein